jgi:serine/threonine protein phosphatase PrpC
MSTTLQLIHAGESDTGRVRAANEDNWGHVYASWGKAFVVCDGMGGHIGGATASALAVKSVLEYLQRDSMAHPAQSLARAIEFANEQIYATALSQPTLKGMGTTCVVLAQKDDGIWIGHVGDSRAYLWHEGQLHRLTRDHSFVQQLIDSGAITEEEAEQHPRRNELLRALGVRATVEVEVTSTAILPAEGDRFLLCSDGLYGMTFDAGIRGILARTADDAEASRLLIHAANDAGGTDNITVSMLTVTGSPHRGSRFQAITIATDLRKTMKVTDLPPAPAPKSSGKSWLIYALMAVAIAAVAVFVAWPDDKAEKEREKFITDSLRNDSIQKVQRDSLATDSIAKAAETLLARRDSLYQDSLKAHKANANKHPKPKVDPKAGSK